MWGYLPGASLQRSSLLSPAVVKNPLASDSSWKDVSGGGCGFAMSITENHEVYTWSWREIPTGRVFGQTEGHSRERNIYFSTEQVSPRSAPETSKQKAISVISWR